MTEAEILKKINNKKIGVLYGGLSSEREISINSGKAVLNALKKLKLNVCGINVDKNIAEKIKAAKINIAYIVLHGSMGEDGTLQGMLEIMGIPYTGCGVISSAMSMDKNISKCLLKYSKISTPKWISLKKFERLRKIKEYPVVVKPTLQGSTIGITIVKNASQIDDAIKKAFEYGEEIIIEQFIAGKEITVGVLNGKALPVIEIVPDGDFYDFKSKYEKGCSKHIVPARINEKAYKKAQNNAEKVYKVFKCKSICRVDMIIGKNDKVWVLENNTIPGMTRTSLLPDGGKAAGYSFKKLVLKILESAICHNRK
jgi:D-alanine-D-alanine ligase